jgi:NAD(P)-dependent dehydrogenase (short-subunit alcohol dehydrogenase family)
MVKQKSGTIINIASIAMGPVGAGFLNLAHYCASKGGIVAMAEALASELAPYNIRINTIAPGAIDTPMARDTKNNDQAMESVLSRIPMKRMGQAQEIADAVLFLASDKSSYINGEVIVVDGGYLAS